MCDKCFDIERDVGVRWAGFVLAFNVIMPGFGTLISAYLHKEGCSGLAVSAAFAQWILAVFVVGWVWSVYSGWRIYDISMKAEAEK